MMKAEKKQRRDPGISGSSETGKKIDGTSVLILVQFDNNAKIPLFLNYLVYSFLE